jgi:organic radical activating enzyme
MSNEQRIHILKNKRDIINSVSSCFCTAKWLQTTLYLQNGFNHSCHHPSPHKIPLSEISENPAALHNSKFKKDQRLKMLNGQRPAECSYCWNTEDLGKDYFSDRHYKTADTWAWNRFNEIAESNASNDVFPSYLEISFSNACNFACSYCSPEISSKWMEDITKNGPYPTVHNSHNLDYLKQTGKLPYRNSEYNPYVDAFWKWFPEALPHLQVLRLTGGEPTMSKDIWALLDYLIDNPRENFEIAINSNLGVPDTLIDKLIKKINQLAQLNMKVDVYTSFESIGIQAEYARDGLNFNTFIANINRVLTETESTVSIMTTINILSVPSFTKFIDTIINLRQVFNHSFEKNRIPLSINYLRWPPYLQCTLLDINCRVKYANEIENSANQYLKYYSLDKYARIYLEEFDQIQRFCEYLRTSDTAVEYRSDFVKFIHAYDNRRNKNFNKTFPELVPYLKEWND